MRQLLISLLVLILTAGCNRLPPDPGLLTEDFGTGISLYTHVSEARSAASSNTAEVHVLSADELATQNPYAEYDKERDLVLALYTPTEAVDAAAGVAVEQITQLRFYLAAPANSQLSFAGEPLAQISADEMEQLLGTPVNRTSGGSDGAIHLSYRFRYQVPAGEPDSRHALKLTTSHTPSGNCFALELATVALP
jgi:hypothetical protein